MAGVNLRDIQLNERDKYSVLTCSSSESWRTLPGYRMWGYYQMLQLSLSPVLTYVRQIGRLYSMYPILTVLLDITGTGTDL
jgi:hypothetical protein